MDNPSESDFDSILSKGIEYARMSKNDEAISYLEKAIEMKDSRGEAFLILGQLYDDLGKKDEAILTYKKGIKAHPNFGDNYFEGAFINKSNVALIFFT